MADKKHLEILQVGVEAWNIWYNAADRGFADFRRARLSCADLSGINLTGARLQDADLRYADLSGADLRGASFNGTNLQRTNLRGARLGDAEGLTRSQLLDADGDGTTELPKALGYPTHWQNRVAVQVPCTSVVSGALA